MEHRAAEDGILGAKPVSYTHLDVYKRQIQVSALTNPGLSEISVTLQGLSRYGITMDRPVSALLRQTDQAVPALAAVSVNGELAKLPAYYINGNNYVRVRDVAVLLGGTGSAFNVEWNSGKNRVELQSFTPYTPLGTENAPLSGETRTVQSITCLLYTSQYRERHKKDN